MKILIVLTYYRPHWTGLSQYAARLAEGLAKKGHQVEVICSQHDKETALEETVNKVKIFRVPYQFRFLRSVIMLGFFGKIIPRINKNEAVLVFLPLQEIVFVSFLTKIFRKKLFLVHNGDLVLPEKGNCLNRLTEKIYYRTTSLGIKNSKGIIIHTEDYAKNSKHLSLFKDKWRVILPPFIIPEIKEKQVENFLKKYKLQGKKLIGFSGRFVEEKGVDYLLEAIPLVIKKIPEGHFIFAGEHKVSYEKFWEKVEPLSKKYQKHISLLGLLNQKEIFVFYKAIEVLVIPSRTDCFPFAQIEAMLSGTPVVCTDIPGARWAIKETGMGELVKPKDPLELTEGIVRVIKNKESYRENFSKVQRIFNDKKSILDYEKLLEA